MALGVGAERRLRGKAIESNGRREVRAGHPITESTRIRQRGGLQRPSFTMQTLEAVEMRRRNSRRYCPRVAPSITQSQPASLSRYLKLQLTLTPLYLILSRGPAPLHMRS